MPAEGEGPLQHDVLNLVYDGCDTTAELVEACGLSAPNALTALVRLGYLTRVERGWYAITAAGSIHIGLRPRRHLRVVS